ncbi:MAG: hypothetical protein COW84_07465 [Gammaproteobacteria bacterium CG22_combo_CG10-13_8_21_14_all_40_8]|nr:MAG: hypothetical protein COW84_07465 [Gammaproteobacteria bacterium CG22_combo_CG10-13_8_21_14_all_40_8]
MRVAFFQPYLANWRIGFLSAFIEQNSHDVIVYDGGFKQKDDPKSLSGHDANFSITRLWNASWVFKYKNQDYPLYFSPFLFFRLIKDRPDRIITEGEINFLNNISIFLYCFLFRKKFIWWSLGKVRDRKPNALTRFFEPIINFLIKRSSCVLARNTLAKTYYLDCKNVNEDKIILAPNSMNTRLVLDDLEYPAPNFSIEGRIILYVGSLIKSKRPLDLLYAFKIMRAERESQDVFLWFVGAGPELEQLQEVTKQLELEKSVNFYGAIFNGVGHYFKRADVVVVPGMGGLVIHHATLLGKPVVSRVADGTEYDLIHEGKNGYILNDYSNHNLAEAITKVLDNQNYHEMCQYSLNLTKNHWNSSIMIDRVNQALMK